MNKGKKVDLPYCKCKHKVDGVVDKGDEVQNKDATVQERGCSLN